jgi:hypothetical protein
VRRGNLRADVDTSRVTTVAERFSSLADNAQAFMSALRRAIDFSDGDADSFIAYKERFTSRDAGHPSQARLLRQAAVTAIKQLVDTVGLDDAAAHRLWRAAFGLSPARHLSVTGDTADEWENVPAGTPWGEAPPIRISPQLRKTGTYERRGRIGDEGEHPTGVDGIMVGIRP